MIQAPSRPESFGRWVMGCRKTSNALSPPACTPAIFCKPCSIFTPCLSSLLTSSTALSASQTPASRCPLHDNTIFTLMDGVTHSYSRSSRISPHLSSLATLWDLVRLLCAGCPAIIFTALLVLLAENDSNDSKVRLMPATNGGFSV